MKLWRWSWVLFCTVLFCSSCSAGWKQVHFRPVLWHLMPSAIVFAFAGCFPSSSDRYSVRCSIYSFQRTFSPNGSGYAGAPSRQLAQWLTGSETHACRPLATCGQFDSDKHSPRQMANRGCLNLTWRLNTGEMIVIWWKDNDHLDLAGPLLDVIVLSSIRSRLTVKWPLDGWSQVNYLWGLSRLWGRDTKNVLMCSLCGKLYLVWFHNIRVIILACTSSTIALPVQVAGSGRCN